MKAIIMAGGEGVRLRPLTCGVPKPLAKLCGRPVVHYILDLLNRYGFTEATFTLGYKSELIERAFEDYRYKGVGLRFSREDSPLGTAGCVKRAFAGGCHEDFLVISGDALCDFDLASVLEYHKRVKAAATIITKRVDDPREYGLVTSDRGRITGFTEKPSYPGCTGDCANTGIYVLSPLVLSLIPDNRNTDFARDVFPRMLAEGMPLYSYEETGYWCDIGDFSTYVRSQTDILSGKVRCHINGEQVADGVWTQSAIPANVKIVPPCYIGANVSFGSGEFSQTVIESGIIGDNAHIGENVKLVGSVVGDSAFISDGVTANHAIICSRAKLLHSASAYEGSVIGEDCRVGREAIVCSGVKIWNDKTIPPGANVTRDVKYGGRCGVELSESGISGETNADITPEICARLGAALSAISRAVAVSCEPDNASAAMKHAVMAGLCGGGADVYDLGIVPRPRLIYAAGLLDCGAIVRIKCGAFTEIEIFGRNGLPLTRPEERRLEGALSRSEYKNAPREEFGGVRAVDGLDSAYAAMLNGAARFKSRYNIKLNCNNEEMAKSLTPVFESVSTRGGEVLVVTITDGGSGAEFYTVNDVKYSREQLLLLAAASVLMTGRNVALPYDFPASADFVAASYGGKIERYFLCSNDSGDERARELAAGQEFLRDGAVLALRVLKYLSQNGMTIEAAVKALPQFATSHAEVEINCPPQKIISMLCSSPHSVSRGEGVLVAEAGNNRENVLIRSSKRGNSLHLFAESLSSETAAELCDNAAKLINKIMRES